MILKSKKKRFWEVLAEYSLTEFNEDPSSYAKLYFEWRYYGYLYPANIIDLLQERGYVLINPSRSKCICGTRIDYQYLILNDFTESMAIIGSTCKEKFYSPKPQSNKSVLMTALSETRNKMEVLRAIGISDEKVNYLLGTTVYYIEKTTKYKSKEIIVSRKYASVLKEVLGLEWKGKVWGE